MFSPPRELLRFRSAPCSLLESLIQEPEPVFQNQCFENTIFSANSSNPFSYSSEETQVSVFPNNLGFEAENHGSELGLFRQNSSPADLFSNFGFSENLTDTIFPNFEFSQLSGKKRAREGEDRTAVSTGILGQLKEEEEEEEHGSQLARGVSSDLEMEKLLEDSVPCRIRAKRGCATHPRSIAERVRRTRISDRIKKLQELVPNMDKQSNTADMLDEAVEYVKFLQKQVKSFNGNASASVNHTQILDVYSSEGHSLQLSNSDTPFLEFWAVSDTDTRVQHRDPCPKFQ